MRFVMVKSVAQQDLLALHRVRAQLVKSRTALCNQLLGLLRERGVVVRTGAAALKRSLPAALADPLSTAAATTLFCSKSNARSVYKPSPPPKMQTERNLQNSHLNPGESSSPVDLGCRIPAKSSTTRTARRASPILTTDDSHVPDASVSTHAFPKLAP
jgi:hypothetical protein